MKRRQRAGLPLYPPEIQAEAIVYNDKPLLQLQHEPLSSSSLSFSLLLSSCYPKKLDDPNHYDYNPPQNNSDSSNHYTNPCPQFNFSNEENIEINETLALQKSPSLSPYPSSSSNIFNQNFTPPSDSHDYQYSENLSYDHHGFNAGSLYDSETPASSYASGVDGNFMGNSSMVNDYYEVAPLSHEGKNSGLLDDLVMEGRSISCNDKAKSEDSTYKGSVSHKRKSMEVEEYAEEESFSMKKKNIDAIQKKDFSTSDLSTGKITQTFLAI